MTDVPEHESTITYLKLEVDRRYKALVTRITRITRISCFYDCATSADGNLLSFPGICADHLAA